MAAIEVTQGLQSIDQGVALVAGKPTAVRVHLQTEGQLTERVDLRLNVRSGDGPFVPLEGIHSPVLVGPDDPLEPAVRGDVGQSQIFTIPKELIDGQLFTLSVERLGGDLKCPGEGQAADGKCFEAT